MKVILLKDVARVGKKYDVKEVADGYAWNRLIPDRLAEAATPENLKRIHALKDRAKGDHDAALAAFQELLALYKDSPLTISAEANDQDHLFKAVKASDVAALLKERMPAFDVSSIDMSPIKEVGEHTIALSLNEVKGSITVLITKK